MGNGITFFIVQRKDGRHWEDQDNLPELFPPDKAKQWRDHPDMMNFNTDENYLAFCSAEPAIACAKDINADGEFRVIARVFKFTEYLVYPEAEAYLPAFLFRPFRDGSVKDIADMSETQSQP